MHCNITRVRWCGVAIRQVTPAFSTNDTELELLAVLRGQAIGQLANFSAAAHIRAGRLVPLLLARTSVNIGLHVYYGSRTAQPRRVRAVLDLAIARLQDCPDYVLSARELAAAAPKSKRGARRD